MKKILFFALIVTLASPLTSFSQGTKNYADLEDISSLYAECAAYYRFASHARNQGAPENNTDTYRRLENTALFYSLLLTVESRSKDMAVAATNTKSEMYMAQMQQEARNYNKNGATVSRKYHFMCQDAMEKPPRPLVDILMTMLQK